MLIGTKFINSMVVAQISLTLFLSFLALLSLLALSEKNKTGVKPLLMISTILSLLCLPFCLWTGYHLTQIQRLKQPSSLPSEVLEFPLYSKGAVFNKDNLLFCYEDRTLTVTFEGAAESIKGYWAGQNPYLIINDKKVPGLITESKNRYEHWGGIIRNYGEILYTICPSFTSRLNFSKKDRYKTVKVKAAMDLVFPTLYDSGFANVNKHLQKEFKLFIITHQDLKSKEDFLVRKDNSINIMLSALSFLIIVGIAIFQVKSLISFKNDASI